MRSRVWYKFDGLVGQPARLYHPIHELGNIRPNLYKKGLQYRGELYPALPQYSMKIVELLTSPSYAAFDYNRLSDNFIIQK